jgi:hypothetical protein
VGPCLPKLSHFPGMARVATARGGLREPAGPGSVGSDHCTPWQQCQIRLEHTYKGHDTSDWQSAADRLLRWHGGVGKSEKQGRFIADPEASQRFHRLRLALRGESLPWP